MDKPELIRTMREAHRRVASTIERVSDERLLDTAMDDWTGKDLLAHLAWWHDHFDESFRRLLTVLEPASDEELFAYDRWPWLGGEALAETILWDSSRHDEAHQAHLAALSG